MYKGISERKSKYRVIKIAFSLSVNTSNEEKQSCTSGF